MKYLSIDPGKSKTGIAIAGDEKLAEGLTTINESNYQKLLQKITRIIDQQSPDQIVIGLPPSGPIRELTKKLETDLEHQCIDLVDEHQTSKIAQDTLIKSNAKRSKRQSREHEVAAAAILQSHLDQI